MNLTSLTKKFHLHIGPWMKILFCLLFSSSVFITIAQVKKKPMKENNEEAGKNRNPMYNPNDTAHKFQIYQNGYNVLFNAGTTYLQRQNRINAIEKYYITYYHRHFPQDTPTFLPFVCPCDSLLVNFNVTVVDGTGVAVTPTPPPPPNNGSGDIVNSNKAFEQDPADTALNPPQGNEVAVLPKKIDNEILAIIDTGIDPRYFKPNKDYQQLLWKARKGNTMYDFTIKGHLHSSWDDNKYKHGTTVTAIALMAMKNSQRYPRIMVLKALDSIKRGSTFTVSCAMSYAIQHKAKIINTSLGYYSPEAVDSVLNHYILLAHSKHILIFTAAGNTPTAHDPTLLCDPSLKKNELKDGFYFYPACLTTQYDNIVSVTGIGNTIHPDDSSACHYQNYSGKYVSVGVINQNRTYCCKDTLRFYPNGVEGTSFVTPVFSGYIMNKILNSSSFALTPGWLDDAAVTSKAPSLIGVTQKGRYIINPIQ